MQILNKLLVLFFLLTSISYAQDGLETEYRFNGKKYLIIYKLEENLQTIRLHGQVYSGIVEDLSGYDKVISLIRKDIPIKLVLHSGGGYLKILKKLPAAMKKNCDSETSNCRITTVVPTWAYCASACVHIFMIGDDRLAGKSSRFGFHQGAAIPGVLKIPGLAQRTLRDFGVDAGWIEANKEVFSSLEMSWLYPRSLDGSNILTGLSEAWES